MTRTARSQRETFYASVGHLVRDDAHLALVLADVGQGYLDPDAVRDARGRVVNVGIREQALIGTAAGLALSGLRPIVHTFAPFLVERPFEQLKLDFDHQQLGGLFVSAGGSYGWPAGGETHLGPRDVALIDTLEGWTVLAPGHPDEAETLLRAAVAREDRVYLRLDDRGNRDARPVTPHLQTVRTGTRGVVLAVGPMLDRVLDATQDLDLTVLYATTMRPFDARGLRAATAGPDVVLVEPWLRGTSAWVVADALRDQPSRLLALGVQRHQTHRFGTVADHDRLQRLDPAGLRADIAEFTHH